MNEVMYSINRDDFNECSAEEAAQLLIDDSSDIKVGDILTVWEADTVRYKASSFLPHIPEYLTESAFDEAREYSEGWEFSSEQEKGLQEAVRATVDKWCSDNKMEPGFFSVRNIRTVKVKVLTLDGDCEIVTPAQVDNER